MRSIIFVVALAACGSSKAPEPLTPPPTSGSPNHAACEADTDCVIVETACCDHCNGGKAEAFNKEFADQHKPTGCEQTACTEMGCGEAIAKCEERVCTVTIAPL